MSNKSDAILAIAAFSLTIMAALAITVLESKYPSKRRSTILDDTDEDPVPRTNVFGRKFQRDVLITAFDRYALTVETQTPWSVEVVNGLYQVREPFNRAPDGVYYAPIYFHNTIVIVSSGQYGTIGVELDRVEGCLKYRCNSAVARVLGIPRRGRLYTVDEFYCLMGTSPQKNSIADFERWNRHHWSEFPSGSFAALARLRASIDGY